MRNPLAIFDLDGTLVDSAGDIRHALNLLLAEYGCAPLLLEEVRDMIGDGGARLIERGFAARQCTAPDLGEALRRFIDLYAVAPVARTEIYPGVVETLQRLHARGITLAVCTNKPIGLSETILAQLGLAPYFSAVLGGDSRPYRKPDPRVLQALLTQFAVSPQQAVMVGDSEVDAATAQAAGVPFILVTYGYPRIPLDAIPRHIAVNHFAQVGDFIPLF